MAIERQLPPEVQALRDRKRAERAKIMEDASDNLEATATALNNNKDTEEARRAEEIARLAKEREDSDEQLRGIGI